jgi:IS30 family transposase
MMGMNHKGALVVMTDRVLLPTSRNWLDHRQINEVSKAIITKLKKAEYLLHTMTFDNDKVFANFMMVEDTLQNNTYFSRPTSSQDKGKVENRIGQIRRFFQKKIDLSACCKRTTG